MFQYGMQDAEIKTALFPSPFVRGGMPLMPFNAHGLSCNIGDLDI